MDLRAIAKKVGFFLWRGLLGFLLLTTLMVVTLRWLDPPMSSFMVQHWVSAWIGGSESPYLHREWVDWEAIAPAVPLAVVAAEDQRFPQHRGFDLVEIEKAWNSFRDGGRLRGASTISQQVAKNLFLWRDRNLVRKGLEAWFTLAIELTWSKRRILEVYLNIAQLGPNTYGVGAASWRYFDRPAVALQAREAALLAAVLPNPERYRLDAPSPYVHKRAAWVRKQMRQLGAGYLEEL
jgi:monofunctional biosynthetic peptidoglycan transglycosylase